MSSCTLPWTGSRQQHGQEFNKNTSMVEHPTIVEDVDQEDSAFLEPEYSNPPSSFESFNQGKLAQLSFLIWMAKPNQIWLWLHYNNGLLLKIIGLHPTHKKGCTVSSAFAIIIKQSYLAQKTHCRMLAESSRWGGCCRGIIKTCSYCVWSFILDKSVVALCSIVVPKKSLA